MFYLGMNRIEGLWQSIGSSNSKGLEVKDRKWKKLIDKAKIALMQWVKFTDTYIRFQWFIKRPTIWKI